MTTNNIKLLTVKELSSVLSMSIGSIYMLIQRQQIPYIKIGRRVRFNATEIENWLSKQKVEVIKGGD